MPDWITDPEAITTITVTVFGIGYIGFRVVQIKRDQQSIERFMKLVRSDIEAIVSRPESAVAKTNSPAQLAELGVKIAERLDARDWARQVAHGLLADVRDKERIGIEEGGTEAVNMIVFDRKWKRRVRRTRFEFRVDRTAVLHVMRVVLKDQVMRLASERALENG